MIAVKMPYPGHDKHLCYLHNVGYVTSNLNKYKELVRDPKYVCKACGRVAVEDNNLCILEKL